jgi:acetylglutamate kinase
MQPALVVVKVGGDVLLDDAQRSGLGRNVKELVARGVRVVIIHGGGPQVTALQEKLGLKAVKIAGRRVTSREDIVVVAQAIAGEVNVGLVSTLLAAGVDAFGCHGASLVRAHKRAPMRVTGQDELVDYGEVGDVDSIRVDLVHKLVDAKVVPVIATLAASSDGRVFNVNADTTAVNLAKSLHADVLLLVTAVGGVFKSLNDPSSRFGTLTPNQARSLIGDGTISGGMIPKVEEALSILDEGVGAVAILGAQDDGAFASAVRGDGAVGTRFAR